VLGRQAFAKFMAAAHYAYNTMIFGPRGIITIHGDPDMAVQCKNDDAFIAKEANKADELAKLTIGVNFNDSSIPKRPIIASSASVTFEASKQTRHDNVTLGDSS
jgi:hypothetical protein